jgi:hypothetical protein
MIREWLSRLYEGEFGPKWFRPYRINPCDADAFAVLKPFGRAMGWFATQCPCCNGVRVVIALLIGLYAPQVAMVLLAGVALAVVVSYIWRAD